MEQNDVHAQKQSIFPQVWPQIYQNTQEGSLQDNNDKKQKKICDDNSQQSLKQVKPSTKKNEIQNRNKTQEREHLNRSNSIDLSEKKHINCQMTLELGLVQQCKPLLESNGEKNASQKLKNGSTKGHLNQCSSSGIRNQFYNNQQADNKLRFQLNQKTNFKNQINFSNPLSSIFSQKLLQTLTQESPLMFLQGSNIVYPIPDYIMQLNDLGKNSLENLENLKPKTLPIGFCYLLDMLNLSYLFPDLFIFKKDIITRILFILQAPSDQIQNQLNGLLEQIFKKFMHLLSAFIVEDLNSERLAEIADRRCQNILSLGKFCQENDLTEFVFKYNWPLVLMQIANISIAESKEENNKFEESLKYMKNSILSQSFSIPENFKLRLQLISLLIDSYTKTNSFRDFLNKKIEMSRNTSKRKSELEEQKKNIQQKIKKLQNGKQKKTKKIVKKEKKKSKHEPSDSEDLSEKQCQSYRLESIEKLLKQLEQVQLDIQKQNRQDSLSYCHYLGKDQHHNFYWYVSFFPQKLFIEQNPQNWLCLPIDQIHPFMDLLNQKTIHQNRLFHKVQEYYKYSISKHLTNMEIENQENNVQNSSGNHLKSTTPVLPHPQFDLQHQIEPQNSLEHDSSKNSVENQELLTGLGAFRIDQQSLCRMIELGQKKMTEYLKDRNSRWGTEENKLTLLSTIKGSGPNWLQEAKKQISLFNQKICVVEIQYKVFVQQSVEQVDSKIKKIQTKIWGINEKFKHNWYDFISSCSCFSQLFFAVSVLYSLIKKYTSKHRKLRKQYEEIKQKTVWKSTPGAKQWRQTWNQICEVCGNTGEVLCCDYCPKVYHLDCVKLGLIPEDQFKCKSCTEQITTRHQLKSIANEGKRHSKK